MRKTSLILLFLLIFTLTACDESLYGPSEPTPVVFDNTEQPPEATSSHTTQPVDGQIVEAIASETTLPDNVLPQWAVDFIPDIFPGAEFTSMIETKSGNFKFAKSITVDCTMSTAQFEEFEQALFDSGFTYWSEIGYTNFYYNGGYNCIIDKRSFDETSDLHSLTIDFS